MKILFVHQGGLGQFEQLARAMAASPDHEVVLITRKDSPDTAGIPSARYELPEQKRSGIHRYLTQTQSHVSHAEGAARAAIELKRAGFCPDIIYVHAGWGEAMFLRDALPGTRVLAYCEKFYTAKVEGAGFSPSYVGGIDQECLTRIRNATSLVSLEAMDWGISPTQWQWSQYPASAQARISIIHDGIDTDFICPNPTATIDTPSGLKLGRRDEIVTYVARNLEPHRGFDIFMLAMEKVLKRRPNAHVVIVGGNERGYGPLPECGGTWRDVMLDRVDIDAERVHFLGQIPRPRYRDVLAVSTVHVYLTYPSVLSWSALEAMSSECFVIGSRTPPVEEVLRDGVTGRLAEFFDVDRIAELAIDALTEPGTTTAMRRAARREVQTRFDLKRVCLPAQVNLLSMLADGGYPALTEDPLGDEEFHGHGK